MKRALALILFLLPSIALGADRLRVVSNAVPSGISGEALNGNPVSDTIPVIGWAKLKVQVRLTRGGAATNVSTTCEESEDGTTWSEIQRDASGTLSIATVTRATVVSLNFSFKIDVAGYVNVRCTFSGAASTGADTIVVLMRVVRGGATNGLES